MSARTARIPTADAGVALARRSITAGGPVDVPARRRWRPGRAVAVAAVVGVAVLSAACGSGPPPDAGTSTGPQSATAQALAFSRCVRAHGVPTFPDPDSRGVWPKSQAAAAANGPRYPAAARACGHLLPDGGPGVAPSAAVTHEIRDDMVRFARCMHAHGVEHWPEPTSTRGRTVFDPQAVGVDPTAPGVGAAMRACRHVFPASIGLPPGA